MADVAAVVDVGAMVDFAFAAGSAIAVLLPRQASVVFSLALFRSMRAVFFFHRQARSAIENSYIQKQTSFPSLG